jgi:hypothetical protein
LNDENVAAPDAFLDIDLDLAVAETADGTFAEVDSDETGDFFSQAGIGIQREQF